MDRFIVKEPRVGAGFPQGNQIMAYPARSGSMVPPENPYYIGYSPNFHQVHQTGMNLPQSINSTNMRHNEQSMSTPHLGQNQQSMNSPHLGQNQQSMNSPHLGQNQQSMNSSLLRQNEQSMNSSHFGQNQQYMNSSHLGQNQQNMNLHQMGQSQTFSTGPTMVPQGHLTGIDPRYLSGYGDTSPQYILAGQHIERNQPPISSFDNDYQNRSFKGVDRMKPKNLQPTISMQPQVMKLGGLGMPKVAEMPKPSTSVEAKNTQNQQTFQRNFPYPKKPNELDLIRNDGQNQMMTRTDKLKALHKSGPRVFSGPVEKVLKWHKTLQDVGILIIYEIVAKCVSVRPGENYAKNLVIRDDNGPAMQVVYYEIDFLLPELKPPCTVRVVGRIVAGTCRLQAFNVRPATGDDVATLPRRAAVAAHHVTKLCKEFGHH